MRHYALYDHRWTEIHRPEPVAGLLLELQPIEHHLTATREERLIEQQQVSRELIWLYAKTGARIATCVGGMDASKERKMLGQGAHIVVGTPGRLRDHTACGRR